MFNLEKTFHIIPALLDPHHINLTQNASDAIKTLRNLPPQRKRCYEGPVESANVALWNVNFMPLQAPDTSKQGLHLRMRKVGRFPQSLRFHAPLDSLETNVSLDVEASLPRDVQLQRSALREELNFVLSVGC